MSRPLTRQLLRFAAVGTIGFVVDAAVLYAVAGALGLYQGRVVSFWAAVTVTWLLNRRFTFDAADPGRPGHLPWWNEYTRYIASMLAGALLNYLAYVAALRGGLSPVVSVALGSLAGMAINFCSARWLVFKHKRKHAPCKH